VADLVVPRFEIGLDASIRPLVYAGDKHFGKYRAYRRKGRGLGEGPMTFNPCCASASLRLTISRTTVSSPIIPCGPHHLQERAVRLPECLDPAAVFEELFDSRGWGRSWRDGIYDYVHYHSSIHEVLGIARGSARVRFGGAKGRALNVRAGDVAILPAGTGPSTSQSEQRFSCRRGLRAVGSL
jgi:hypothetical protein